MEDMTLTINVDRDMADALLSIQSLTQQERHEMVRQAILDYLRRQEREYFN